MNESTPNATSSGAAGPAVRPAFIVALVATLLLGGAVGWYWYTKWQAPAGSALSADVLGNLATEATSAPTIPRFILTDQFGRPFDTATARGRYWIITFGSTAPADENTPTVASNLATLQRNLLEAGLGDEFTIMLITNRPSVDTPERFAELASSVNAEGSTWRLLSTGGEAGKAAGIEKLAREIIKLPAPRRSQIDGLPGDSSTASGADPTEEGEAAPPLTAASVREPIVDPGTVILTDPRGRVLNWFGGLDPREIEALERDLRSHREATANDPARPTAPTEDDETAPPAGRNRGTGMFPFPFGGN